MRSSFKKLFAPTALSLALVLPSFTLRAQDSGQTVTRPRRANASAAATPAPDSTPAAPTPDAAPDAERGARAFDESARAAGEPFVRIGLAVNARAVNVSTTGRLLNATDGGAAPVPFEVARLRVEPRSLPPHDATQPHVEVDEGGRGETAAAAATKGDDPNRSASRGGSAARGARATVQLTSRASAPARGQVLYAHGSTRPLLDARAPILFASDDEAQHPVRFNEKAYRGRLEVFANTRGSLTVVNVVPLEEYVRGVVPNELSPGGWPEIEALKAQAVAARTYAVSNLGRFASDGFDLTPDTRSQVYGGRSTEHPLTDRAVAETRGRVAAYRGAPINALYTSTCGGRTEDAENIFGGERVPYLRGRECALESGHRFLHFTVRTSRDLPDVKAAEHAASPRDAALLSAHGFRFSQRPGDDWLAAPSTPEELHEWVGRVASLARQPAPRVPPDATRPGGFAAALAAALDGESRGATLLNSADVNYLLAFRDADDVPAQNRADVAAMLQKGHLSLHADGTLRPRQPMSRARVLRSLAHALEARALFNLQSGAARSLENDTLVVRKGAAKPPDVKLKVAGDAHLFMAFGERPFPVREVRLVGGEAVVFHTNASGEIDYLEARPAPGGAATDRYSQFTNWSEKLTPSGVLSRMGNSVRGVGDILDLRVRRRGVSGRVLDLEVIGTGGVTHVRGGRVRTALRLREQLFVIDRTYDEGGRVSTFTFSGRGWGHGVGMCQVGAFGLARAGLSYEKILKWFYTDISVSKLY